MEQVLKIEIVDILNKIQRGDAPELVNNDIVPLYTETSKHKFDLIDSKDGTIIKDFEAGTAHYINGNPTDTYKLKIICYDDFIHKFTFDDKNGNLQVNRLKNGVRVADFLIHDESKAIFIVQELSNKKASKKKRVGQKQLSDTLNQLYKSKTIADFINSFKEKICYLSAKDDRKIISPGGMAGGFSEIYDVLPSPLEFKFGQIGTYGFSAFETSYVELKKYD